MLDILVEIPDSDLPKLKTFYQKHIEWAPCVDSFIGVGIKWKKSEKYRNKMTFMSPNNNWEKDGTIVVLMEFYSYDVFVFTLDETCENLFTALMETNRIRWDNRRLLFFSVHEKHVPTVEKVLKSKNRDVGSITCNMFTIPAEDARNFTIDPPSEVYLKDLEISAANQINAVWPHRSDDSEKYLATLIEMNGGIGVYLKSTDELVAWAVVHCLGILGMIQTEDNYKNKGYGSLVTKALSKKLGDEGVWPFGTVLIKNTASLYMFNKLGFKDIGHSTYLLAHDNM